MGAKFKITDIDNECFYQIPKSLLTQKNYKGLNSDAKIIYSILRDRMSLSRKNKWKDENDDIFLLFKQQDISDILGLSTSTVSRAMKQLETFGLIEVKRQGLNRPNKIYIHKIDLVDEEDISNIDDAFFQEEVILPASLDLQERESGLAGEGIRTCTGANQDLQERKSRLAPVQTNNNYISNTEKNNTENNNNKDKTVDGDLEKIINILCSFGAKKNQAKEIIQEYGIDMVNQQIDLLLTQKGVKNAMGWLICALKSGGFNQVAVDLVNKFQRQTVDNGKVFVLPETTESLEYESACAQIAASAELSQESPFWDAYKKYIAK